MTGPMDTIDDRMRQFRTAGWREPISVSDGGLRCGSCAQWVAPDDVAVDEVDRFEGASDPGDEAILFAITMPCGHRGVLPAAYGKDASAEVAEVMTRLPRNQS